MMYQKKNKQIDHFYYLVAVYHLATSLIINLGQTGIIDINLRIYTVATLPTYRIL